MSRPRVVLFALLAGCASPPATPPAAAPPPARPHAAGRLAPDVIQGVVRRAFDSFRPCYEAGLGRDAHLTGEVRVRFVIGLDGTVQSAADERSTMPDLVVTSCVLDQFRALVFPRPDGGIVTVVYPIQFAPKRE